MGELDREIHGERAWDFPVLSKLIILPKSPLFTILEALGTLLLLLSHFSHIRLSETP